MIETFFVKKIVKKFLKSCFNHSFTEKREKNRQAGQIFENFFSSLMLLSNEKARAFVNGKER
jgi:hypothetical protein